ncbi:hypothetical protein GTO89_07755 [Heliobacterium gestii]|uniref:Uncharacterized protein n=1 Tax=Heliomicrobium gestii TaxID=2699 RepID=A0A845LDC1_HELGE|nr:CBO0543 family protein [Heliomicrobium gestii]MBM7866277.1 hypothetical protein [Heliomicrobium gestii]MZP42930.1 hypothetical protein [Heliomicrobium gestii]
MVTDAMLLEARLTFNQLSLQHYLESELFSTGWWFIVGLLTVFYVTWWKLLDKSRFLEILLFGSFMAVSNAFMDNIGTSSSHWMYFTRLVPLSPGPFPIDYTVVPILFMLAYQYTNTWKTFLLGSAIAGFLLNAIIFPIMVSINIKHHYNFSLVYYFFLGIGASLLCRYLILAIIKRQFQAEGIQDPSPLLHPSLVPARRPIEADEE